METEAHLKGTQVNSSSVLSQVEEDLAGPGSFNDSNPNIHEER